MPSISFNIGRKQPVKSTKRKSRKKSWLDDAAKESDGLLATLKKNNATLQAAIIKHRTGVDIEPKDIHIDTPEDRFMDKVYENAINEVQADDEFMQEAKFAAIDRIRNNVPGQASRYRRYQGGDGYGGPYQPGDYFPGWGGFGSDGFQSPLYIVDTFKQIKEAMEGETGGKFTPILTEIVKQLPLFFGQKPAPSQPARPVPQLIAVEVDGEFVEMTRQSYEIFKRQQEQIKRLTTPTVSTPPVTPQAVTPEPAAPAPEPPAPAPSEATPEMSQTDITAPPEQPAKVELAPEPDEKEGEIPEDYNIPIEQENEQKKLELPEDIVKLFVEIGKRIVDGMELSPEKFARKVYEDTLEDDAEDAIFMFNFLVKLEDHEEIVEKLQMWKGQTEFIPFIEKIELNRDWVEAALTKLKEYGNGSNPTA